MSVEKPRNLSDIGTEDILSDLLESSKFYLTVKKDVKIKGKQNIYHLGNISMKLSSPHGISIRDGPPLCDEYYLYVNPETNTHMVYYEFFENDENQSSSSQKTVLHYLAKADITFKCFECLKVKATTLLPLLFSLNI